MRKKSNNVVFKKLIFLFLIIVMPLILISSTSLIMSNNKLTRETLQSYYVKNQRFVDVLDNELTQIYKSASSVISHSKLTKLSYISNTMNAFERVQAIQQLREYISSIKGNSFLIHNIRVYVRSLLQAYNSDGYDKGSYQNITETKYQEIVELKTNMTSPMFYDGTRLIMLLFPSLGYPENIVEVELQLNNLEKEFTKQSLYDNAYYIFNFNDNNYVLDNIDDENFYQTILSSSYNSGVANIDNNKRNYHAFYTEFEHIDAYYIQIIPSDVFLQPLILSNVYTILFIIFMLICVLIFLIGTIKLIHHPLQKLIKAFQKVETGDLSVRIIELEENDFSYLYKGFNNMTYRLETVITEVYKQKLLLQNAEFKQLQAQINPHFLYNSFFMLQRMIKSKMQEEAEQVSKELGAYFQYITRNNSDFVYFKDEYRHAQIYSNIQSMRFEGRISTEFGELPAAFDNMKVPRLILQPIIENAYLYGLENKISNGFLRVSFLQIEHGIHIVIEDNGEELTDDKLVQLKNSLRLSTNTFDSAEVTGLINIYRRIQIFFKNDSALSISRSSYGGLKVTIYLE